MIVLGGMALMGLASSCPVTSSMTGIMDMLKSITPEQVVGGSVGLGTLWIMLTSSR